MPEIPGDGKMKICDFEYLYSDKVTCCKWLDRRQQQCCLVMLKEWEQYILFHDGKKDQHQKSKDLAHTLSKCTTKERVVLT